MSREHELNAALERSVLQHLLYGTMLMFNLRTVLPVLNHVVQFSFRTVYNNLLDHKVQASLYPVKDITALYKSILHYITYSKEYFSF